MINNFIKLVTSVFLFFALSGCELPLMPVDAEQTFVIAKGNDIKVSYSGRFTHFCDDLISMAKIDPERGGKMLEEFQHCSQETFDKTKNLFSTNNIQGSISFLPKESEQFKIEYQVTLNSKIYPFGYDLPCATGRSICDKVTILSYAKIQFNGPVVELLGDEKAYDSLREAKNPKDPKFKDLPVEAQKLFERILKKFTIFRVQLVVQTDKYVTSHNASSVTPMNNEFKEYRWNLNGDSPPPSLKAVDDKKLGKKLSWRKSYPSRVNVVATSWTAPANADPFNCLTTVESQ